MQAMKNSEVGMPMPDEHYILDDNKYVADIMQDFKAAKGRDYQSKILFKKRMFRETDETITEPQFVTLSYVQVRICHALHTFQMLGMCTGILACQYRLGRVRALYAGLTPTICCPVRLPGQASMQMRSCCSGLAMQCAYYCV